MRKKNVPESTPVHTLTQGEIEEAAENFASKFRGVDARIFRCLFYVNGRSLALDDEVTVKLVEWPEGDTDGDHTKTP